MGAAPLMLAFGLPEIAGGFKQAGKDMKQVRTKKNKYDAILNPGQDMIKPLDAERTADTINDFWMEKIAADKKNKEGYYLKSYGIPAALLAATLIRGRMTNNYLQPIYDIGRIGRKAIPGIVDESIAVTAKNPNLGAKARFWSQSLNKANQANKKNGTSIGQSVVSGMGFVGGGAAAEYGVEKLREKRRQGGEFKRAHDILGLKKEAADFPNTALNHVRKIFREGIVMPSVYAVPIYAAPVAISYAINKDIKTDFSPVRNLSEKQRDAKNEINESQTDYASYNNAALNREFAKVAKKLSPIDWDKYFKDSNPLKTEAETLNWKKFFEGDKYPFGKSKQDHIRVKDYKDLPEDALISGLRATSMAIPITLLAQSDPIEQMKGQIRMDAMKNQQKAQVKAQKKVIKKVVKTELKKELSRSVVNPFGSN